MRFPLSGRVYLMMLDLRCVCFIRGCDLLVLNEHDKMAEYGGGFTKLKSIVDSLDAADTVDTYVLTYLHSLVDKGSTKRLRNVAADRKTILPGAA